MRRSAAWTAVVLAFSAVALGGSRDESDALRHTLAGDCGPRCAGASGSILTADTALDRGSSYPAPVHSSFELAAADAHGATALRSILHGTRAGSSVPGPSTSSLLVAGLVGLWAAGRAPASDRGRGLAAPDRGGSEAAAEARARAAA
jgi:hypothetical protein